MCQGTPRGGHTRGVLPLPVQTCTFGRESGLPSLTMAALSSDTRGGAEGCCVLRRRGTSGASRETARPIGALGHGRRNAMSSTAARFRRWCAGLRHMREGQAWRSIGCRDTPPGQMRPQMARVVCPPTVNRSAPPPLGSPGSSLDGCGRGRRCLPSAWHRRAGKSACARRSRRSPLRPASG